MLDDGLIWRTRFTNTLYVQNKLWPNDTDVSIHMTPIAEDSKQQHIAFEKIKYVFNKILQNSLFIDNNNQYPLFEKFDTLAIDFFEKPVDQVVGICLYTKLNAIIGNCLRVDTLEIESWQGENLRFIISESSPENDLLQSSTVNEPWWKDKSPRFSNFTKEALTWERLGFTIDESSDKFKIIQGGR